MKNIYYVLLGVMFLLMACDDELKKEIESDGLINITVELVYPDDYLPEAGASVSLANTANGSEYVATTDVQGRVVFKAEPGIYRTTVTEKRLTDTQRIVFSGSVDNVVITKDWDETKVITATLAESIISRLVIKELYTGGCPKDDGSGSFAHDKYIILYNNSDEGYNLQSLCLAMTIPYNSNGTNVDNLFYEEEGWIPAGQGFWEIPNEVVLPPYSQIVIVIRQAIDHTPTYSQSVNLANPDYYCMYDMDTYNHANYVAPSELIPVSHYLKGYNYGSAKVWALSDACPGFFIFKPEEGVTPAGFAADADNINYYNNSTANIRKKVPLGWVVDGVEVFRIGVTNTKRVPTLIDNGYVEHSNTFGYTVYRNVDVEETLAIEGNEEKLVYGYRYGTSDLLDEGGSTDPSGIDAEASIKNGAIIIYQDTNNSELDFHLRSQASLRD